jgi:hypothetical protein
MANLIDYIRKPFDLLYAYTSDETDGHGIYADTRSTDGHFSITSTQSGMSTYAAYEEDDREEMPGSVVPKDLETDDCEDPRTCPDCEPVVAHD